MDINSIKLINNVFESNFPEVKDEILKEYKKISNKNNENLLCSCCFANQAEYDFYDLIGEKFKEKNYFYTQDGFCSECTFILKNEHFRNSNFIITKDKFIKLSHQEIYKYLFDKTLELPNLFSFTSSYKKSNVLYLECNYSNDKRIVLLEQQKIEYDLNEDLQLYNAIHILYNTYNQAKDCIMTGEYNTSKLTNKQYNELKNIENGIVKQYRGSLILNLLIFYVQKEEIK